MNANITGHVVGEQFLGYYMSGEVKMDFNEGYDDKTATQRAANLGVDMYIVLKKVFLINGKLICQHLYPLKRNRKNA